MWIQRDISDALREAAKTFPSLILTGARQVGKTSLLEKLFPEHSFVTLDLPSNAELAERQPEEFLRRFPPPVIIDEVQYAPGLFRHLKKVIDDDRKSYGRFILTGSQKFTLMKSVSDSLAGRCAIFELETLSSHEILSVRNVSETDLMFLGGFPELNARPELNRNTFYQSYVATYLERDVRSLLHVGGLRDFERFLRAGALRSGQILNKSEMGRDVGISPTTANEWISVLEASNQILLLEPWFNNKTKSLIKSPKLFFADTGLLCFLMGLNSEEELLRSPLLGSIWETFVFSELRKKQMLKNGKWDLWLWRDNRGLEIDFILQRGGRFTLIEAKYTEKPGDRETASLLKVASLIGMKNVENMVIVCRTRASFPLGDGISVVPLQDIGDFL